MNLVIYKKPEYTKHFMLWVMTYYKKLILYNINWNKIKSQERILKNLNLVPEKYSGYKVIKYSLKNLQLIESNNVWIIRVNPITNYLNTNKKLINLLNLMCNGILGVRGVNILLKPQKAVKTQISRWYEAYMEGA
jgi:hypothetical protein